jgi:hypothetical protein
VSWTHTRSAIAHTLKRNPEADVTELRLLLKAQRLADQIEKIVNSAPALTESQKAQVAALLVPTPNAAAIARIGGGDVG